MNLRLEYYFGSIEGTLIDTASTFTSSKSYPNIICYYYFINIICLYRNYYFFTYICCLLAVLGLARIMLSTLNNTSAASEAELTTALFNL